MEPSESLVETSRLREFQLLKAFEGHLPIPKAFWCDADAEHLPYPALICGFVDGVTAATGTRRNATGFATMFPRELREALAPQFVEHLGIIHQRSFSDAGLTVFDVPAEGTTQCAEWLLNWWDRIWEEDGEEEVPLLRLTSSWLRRNMPVTHDPSIIHGDYRSGNFLFTEHDARITAWLDWELGRIGDRHQDLAYLTMPCFAIPDDDSGELQVCGIMPESKFFDIYEATTGFQVNREALQWYSVFNYYWVTVLCIGTSYRVVRNGKTHQDILVTWIAGLISRLLDELRECLERSI